MKRFSLSYIQSEFTNPFPCRKFYKSARNFEEHDLSYEQWKSVLHLSTRWGFASLRKLALRSIKPPTAFHQLLLARIYNVNHWVLPALSALCKRKRPTNVEEARQMNIEDIVVVATVREKIRSRRPFADTAEIERRIEAAQAKVVAHVDDGDSESEGETEYVANTILEESGVESATHPYPVFPSFGRHPPVSGQPAGTPIMMNSLVTPPDRPVSPPGRLATPPGRPVSPSGRLATPPGRPVSPSGRLAALPVRPVGRLVTPPSRPVTPHPGAPSHWPWSTYDGTDEM